MDFLKRRPLTIIFGAYLFFAWAHLSFRIWYGFPPFRYFLLFGIIGLATISDWFHLAQINFGYYILGTTSTPPEFNLFVAFLISIVLLLGLDHLVRWGRD